MLQNFFYKSTIPNSNFDKFENIQSLMNEQKKLKGLLPYQEEDNSFLYGREKEVENLLQIIQKNKPAQK